MSWRRASRAVAGLPSESAPISGSTQARFLLRRRPAARPRSAQAAPGSLIQPSARRAREGVSATARWCAAGQARFAASRSWRGGAGGEAHHVLEQRLGGVQVGRSPARPARQRSVASPASTVRSGNTSLCCSSVVAAGDVRRVGVEVQHDGASRGPRRASSVRCAAGSGGSRLRSPAPPWPAARGQGRGERGQSQGWLLLQGRGSASMGSVAPGTPTASTRLQPP